MTIHSASRARNRAILLRDPSHDINGNIALRALAAYWMVFLFRGIGAIFFGLLALGWGGAMLSSLIFLYGLYLTADGVAAIVASVAGGIRTASWWLAAAGTLSMAAGFFALSGPDVTILVLLYIVAGWCVVSGAIYTMGAIALWHEIALEWLLLAGGILSICFGSLLATQAGVEEMLIWIIGSYAILYGILLTGLSLRLRECVGFAT